jgi:hypothetical protein
MPAFDQMQRIDGVVSSPVAVSIMSKRQVADSRTPPDKWYWFYKKNDIAL